MISMFARKKKDVPSGVGLSLPVLQPDAAVALEAKLQSEIRYCGTCSYEIHNPMTDRCPRCFGYVALSDHTNCGECSHQGNCTYKEGS